MIGRLRGVLLEVGDEEVMVEAGGLGYMVRCGVRTIAEMPALGAEVILYIDSQTREDGTKLFGFLSRDERRAFELLLGVQGVGPKAALAILDVLSPPELATALIHEDRAAVERASGVGAKLAQRVILELKPKAAQLGEGFAGLTSHMGSQIGIGTRSAPMVSGNRNEAVTALIGLGVAEAQARTAVDQVIKANMPDMALPALIKAALKALGTQG